MLDNVRRHVYDKNGERYELREVFDAYCRFGGIPGIADVGFNQEKALTLLDGIYSTVIMHDILVREYGIYAVRGPRGVPNSLSHVL